MCLNIDEYKKYTIQSQKLSKGAEPRIHKNIISTKKLVIALEEEMNKNNPHKNILIQIRKTKKKRNN